MTQNGGDVTATELKRRSHEEAERDKTPQAASSVNRGSKKEDKSNLACCRCGVKGPEPVAVVITVHAKMATKPVSSAQSMRGTQGHSTV